MPVPPGCTPVVTACTLTHIRTGGALAVGVGVGVLLRVGVGVLLRLGVGVGVLLGVGVGVLLGVGVGVLLGVGVGVLLGVGVGVGVVAGAALLTVADTVALAVGVAVASPTADTESSWRCASAALTSAELIAAVAGCGPHVFVAAVVYADCAGCVPARNALTSPVEIIDAPANTVSADGPTRPALMMAPSSSCSSHPGSRASSCLIASANDINGSNRVKHSRLPPFDTSPGCWWESGCLYGIPSRE